MVANSRIARIAPTSLRDGAYGALRDAFNTGQFAPGDVLTLQGLADQLGISMTPVREAVRRLVAEGALIDTPSRTLVVPRFDLRRMQELRSARLALETLLLDQAMDRSTPDWIAGLEATLRDDSGQQGDGGPNLRQNHAFHFGLYRHSASSVLLPLVEGLWLQYGTYLNLIMRHPETARIADHSFHHAIIDALRRGDRAAARAALIDDIDRSFRVLATADEPEDAP
jgi:DNA-binding GntR family transcriptional regulator